MNNNVYMNQQSSINLIHDSDIAIVGMSCRLPGAKDIKTFWQNLRNGVESISFFTYEELLKSGISPALLNNPNYVKASGWLEDIEMFDAEFFGLSPKEAAITEPQHRLFLECSWEALENAGYDPERYEGTIGVYAGTGMNTYVLNHLHFNQDIFPNRDLLESVNGFKMMVGNDKDYLPTRVSYKLNFKGPSININTACSTSLVAVHLACQSLLNGECDMALAGGASVRLLHKAGYLYQEDMIFSPDGHCRAFDAKAQGTVGANGVGVVVLKRLADAYTDGDCIDAIIKGSAINNDGSLKIGFTAPSIEGQAAVISEAMGVAGVEAESITYVETHGTGTTLGDPIEIAALTQAFCAKTDQKGYCAIGSLKTNIGHVYAAAGVAGLIKTVLALKHKLLPPSLHFDKPNPKIDFTNSPFYVNTKLSEWKTEKTYRRAGVSSFGIGGTNAHVILEEAPETIPIGGDIERPQHILTLSARSEKALQDLAQCYKEFLASEKQIPLADVCFTANTGRARFNHRLAIVAQSTEQLHERLDAFVSHQQTTGLVIDQATTQTNPKIAFLFTGQGSQYVNMGYQFYETQPTFRQTLDYCDKILRPYLEKPLLEVLYSGTTENSLLDQTAYTQPALFALEYALAKLWMSWGIQPTAVMGHSLSEYVAACIAGVFSLEDGLKLVAERGRLMQALPQEGMMVAVFADATYVTAVIEPYASQISIAAFNGPKNTVISGECEALQKVIAILEVQEVKTKQLNVSHAFHSQMMEPMLADFERVAREVSYSLPQLDIISNLTGNLATEEIATPEYWCLHVRQPVKFETSIKTLYQQGYEILIEIGPKPTLLGMGQQCLASEFKTEICPSTLWLPSLRSGKSDWEQILESLGELYVRGVTVDWFSFDKDNPRHRLHLPTYPFQRQRHWIDATVLDTEGILAHTNGKSTLSHPLLDHKFQSPLLKEILFESKFSAANMPFLKEHRVYEKIVAPGACYISLLLGAAELTFEPKGCLLANVIFPQALQIPEEGARTVQLIITPEDKTEAAFKLISFETNTANENSSWAIHATGKILTGEKELLAQSVSNFNSLEEVQSSCLQEMSSTELYQTLQQHQIQLGPSFQWIQSIWKGDREALGLMRVPETLFEVDKYQLHPGLIDSCFQLLAATVSTKNEEAFVPFSIERFKFNYCPRSSQFWCHTYLRQVDDLTQERLIGDMQLFDQNGQVIAEIVGFEGRKVSHETLLSQLQEPTKNWLYEIKWQPKISFQQLQSQYLPTPIEIQNCLIPQLTGLSNQYHVEVYEELLPQIEALSVSYIVHAFRQMAWDFQPQQTFSTESISKQLGISNQYQRLLNRLLEILAEEGFLQQRGTQWEVIQLPETQDPQEQISKLFTQYSTTKTELTLLERCGSGLASALRGECDPLQLLFPSGDFTDAADLYQHSPGAQLMNTLVQKAVLSTLEKLPPGRGVRVLEIGGGTGGATSYVLPCLNPNQTEYLFTDIGALFVTRAQEKFREYPFVHYQVLDIEQAPESQGFERHQFNIVIASNVLHATKDLHQTLQHVHNLMARGGILILLEGIAPLRWMDLVFGFTEGWWRFTDFNLRPKYPLLSTSQWQELLIQTGFNQVETIPPAPKKTGVLSQQAVIVAQAATEESKSTSSQPGTWLILADSQGIGQQLKTLLQSKAEECILVFPDMQYQQTAEQEFRIDPNNLEHFQRLLEIAGTSQHPLKGIVHLWSIDAVEAQNLTISDIETASCKGCGSTLHLFQSLVKAELLQLPSLFLVTKGAVPVGEKPNVTGVAQAPLWGMGKTIALEYPELNCVRLDLDPNAQGNEAQTLFEEIYLETTEDQIAFRDNLRYVARLIRSPQSQTVNSLGKLHFHEDGTYLISGGLGGLGLLVASWMVKHGAKHLVLVGRSAPNPMVIEQLKEIEQAGSQMIVMQADVSQQEQIAHVLTDIESSLPPLRGIIHAAGFLSDGILLQQNWERFTQVMAPKVEGVWNLHTLTQNKSLDFFIMFSSAASLLGSPGQANHGAANAFLDALAYYRQSQQLAGLSINWGAWSEVGAAARHQVSERMKIKGIETMSPAQGLQILEQLLLQESAQVGVVHINWSIFLQQFSLGSEPPLFLEFVQQKQQQVQHEQTQSQQIDLLNQLKQANPLEYFSLLTPYIKGQVAKTLGLSVSQIDIQQPLNNMGLDSLMAIELRNRIETDLRVALSMVLFLQNFSIAELVAQILPSLNLVSESSESINKMIEEITL